MRPVKTLKAVSALLIALAAFGGGTRSAHAGTISIEYLYYQWTPSFTTTLYDGGAPLTTYTFEPNAYIYSGYQLAAIASGPQYPTETVGVDHIYLGGPANDSFTSFLPNEPYAEIVNGEDIVFQETFQNPPPAPPTTVTLFVLQYPVSVSASSEPQ
jgi:hypothetical protein